MRDRYFSTSRSNARLSPDWAHRTRVWSLILALAAREWALGIAADDSCIAEA
jgi:hypothetical protein